MKMLAMSMPSPMSLSTDSFDLYTSSSFALLSVCDSPLTLLILHHVLPVRLLYGHPICPKADYHFLRLAPCRS